MILLFFHQGCSSSSMSSTGFFILIPVISSRGTGEKKIYLNTILVWRAKYQYLVSPFESWNLLGAFWKDFEAPAWILRLTDVSINPQWSGTPQPTSEQCPLGPHKCHWLSQMLSLGAPLQVGFPPWFGHFFCACLSDQEGLSSCGVSSEGSLSAAEHFQATAEIEKYPHTTPLQRVKPLQMLCGSRVSRRWSLSSLSTQTIVGFRDSVMLWTTKLKVTSFCTFLNPHRYSGTSVLWQTPLFRDLKPQTGFLCCVRVKEKWSKFAPCWAFPWSLLYSLPKNRFYFISPKCQLRLWGTHPLARQEGN